MAIRRRGGRWEAMQRAGVVMVDGTCWRDDELVALGVSQQARATWATCRRKDPAACSNGSLGCRARRARY